MKARLTGTGMLVAAALVLPMVLAVCCVMGPSRPGPVVSQATNVEFISGGIGWEYDENGRVANKSICTLRIRNVGNDPIRSVRFRLTLRYQHSNEPVYSRVHTLRINLGPRDIVSQKFYLQEKIDFNATYIFQYDEVVVR